MKIENPFDFSGKVVLVTGAAVGIGAAVARRFGRAGGKVCITYRHSAEEAEKLVEECQNLPGSMVARQVDMQSPASIQKLFKDVKNTFSGLHVLVNNAGIYPVEKLTDMDVKQWKETIDTNLTGPFICTREAAGIMKETEGAENIGCSIINIGSIESENPGFGHSHYTASKAGLVMFTRAAAQELGPLGIRVNAVSPGLIYSNGLFQAWPEGIHDYLREVPLGRLGTGDDVADACLFLSSPAARWISGINLRVDGGMIAGRGY